MKPPVTPKPMPAYTPEIPLDRTNKLFGILCITLTGCQSCDKLCPQNLWPAHSQKTTGWLPKIGSLTRELAQTTSNCTPCVLHLGEQIHWNEFV
ncbi:hypothetical protein DSO57_1022419 [Entomophthora muscae]|uniref:Uncharacterized protein n=1 Tax=Entomophthora muscae TaxID=34485 RepID=A0ACC2S5D7_9FUNG|nr:hypothetical protein DSO57_1022419 [Entomophthora muscae]